MYKFKRTIALLLALVLALSMSTFAFADTEPTNPGEGNGDDDSRAIDPPAYDSIGGGGSGSLCFMFPMTLDTVGYDVWSNNRDSSKIIQFSELPANTTSFWIGGNLTHTRADDVDFAPIRVGICSKDNNDRPVWVGYVDVEPGQVGISIPVSYFDNTSVTYYVYVLNLVAKYDYFQTNGWINGYLNVYYCTS